MSRPSLLLILLTAAACGSGGGSPSGPTSPATPASIASGTALTVASGEDGRGVAGASVTINGQSSAGPFTQTYTTDAGGRFVLDRQLLLSPTPLVDVVSAAFLSRNTQLRSSDDTLLTLWPKTSASGLDEEASSTLVYSAPSCPAQNVANAPLRRLSSSVRQVSVVLGAGLQDAGVEDAHRAAIARLNGAVAGTVLYALAPSAPGSGVSFSSELDPADPNCTAGDVTRAATYVNHANDEIVGGRMVFCNVDSARDTLLVLHELGHTYGLNHSVSAHDVMFCQMGRPAAFAAREVLLMGLMRTRRPGNRWPDNDRAAVAPLRGRETVASVCG